MSYSISDCFMIAFAAGFLFGLVYEALRIARLILRFKAAVFVCDTAFFMLAALAVLGLSEELGNYVRVYTVLGFGAGVFAYIVTVGRIFNLAESAAASAWRHTIGQLIHNIGNFAKEFFVKAAHKSQAGFGIIYKYCGSAREKCVKHLQTGRKMMYNKKKQPKIGEGEEVHVITASVRRSP